MTKDVEDALDRYYSVFHESFPLFNAGLDTNAEIISAVNESIAKGEPYDPKFEPDCLY